MDTFILNKPYRINGYKLVYSRLSSEYRECVRVMVNSKIFGKRKHPFAKVLTRRERRKQRIVLNAQGIIGAATSAFDGFRGVCDNILESNIFAALKNLINSLISTVESVNTTVSWYSESVKTALAFAKSEQFWKLISESLLLFYEVSVLPTYHAVVILVTRIALLAGYSIKDLAGVASKIAENVCGSLKDRKNDMRYETQGNLTETAMTSLFSVLLAVTGYGLTKKVPGKSQVLQATDCVGSLFRNVTNMVRGVGSVKDLIGACWNLIDEVICIFTGESMLQRTILRDLTDSQSEIRKYVNDVFHYSDEAQSLLIRTNPDAQKRIAELYDMSEKITEEILCNSKFPAGVALQLAKLNEKVKELRKVTVRAPVSVARQEPFCIALVGNSGIGKSQLTEIIAEQCRVQLAVGKALWGPYFRKKDKHWVGYAGQYCTVIDDFGQFQSKPDDTDMNDIISMITCTPWITPQAELTDKGMQFESQVVVLTSNDPYPAPKCATSQEAILRRRHLLIEVVKHKDVAQDDAEFTHLKYIIRDSINPLTPGTTITTLEDLLTLIRKNMIAWRKKQAFLLKAKKERTYVVEPEEEVVAQCMPEMLPTHDCIINRESLFWWMWDNFGPDFDGSSLEQTTMEIVKEQFPHHWHERTLHEWHVMGEIYRSDEWKEILAGNDPDNNDFEMAEYAAEEQTFEEWNLEEANWPTFSEVEDLIEDELDLSQWDWEAQAPSLASMMEGRSSRILQLIHKKSGKTLLEGISNFVLPREDEELNRELEFLAYMTQLPRSRLEADLTARYKREYLSVTTIRDSITSWLKDTIDIAGDFIKETANAIWKDQLLRVVWISILAVACLEITVNMAKWIYKTGKKVLGKDSYEAEFASGDQITRWKTKARVVSEAGISGDQSTRKFTKARVVAERSLVCEGTADLAAKNVLDNVIMANMCLLNGVSTTGTMQGVSGLFIGGHDVLCPAHYLKYFEAGDMIRLRKVDLPTPYDFEFDPKHIVHLRTNKDKNKDLAIIRLPWRGNSSRNIWKKHFFTEKDLSKANSVIGMLTIPEQKSVNSWVFQTQKGPIKQVRKLEYTSPVAGSMFCTEGWHYNFSTTNGSCGSILTVHNESYPRKIAGMHVAGVSDKDYGVSEVLTQESIAKGIAILDKRFGIDPEGTVVQGDVEYLSLEAQAPKIMPDAPYRVYGTTPAAKKAKCPETSDIIPSPIHGFVPPQTFPSVMSPRDERVDPEFKGISPLVKGIGKYAVKTVPFPMQDLQVAIEDSNAEIMLWENSLQTREVRTEEEAINGVFGMKGYERMNMQSSEGYPYILRRPKGLNNKSWMFKNIGTENNPHYIVTDRELRERLDRRLNLAKRGQRMPAVAVDTCKDERRKIEKIRTADTRVFNVMPVDHLILMSMYFGDYLAAWVENRITGNHSIGVDPVCSEWTTLATKLRSKGTAVSEGDFKLFDSLADPEIQKGFADGASQWYGDEVNSESYIVRRVLVAETAFCLHLALDCLYQVSTGLPSGAKHTIVLNSYVNRILHKVAWRLIMRNKNPALISMESYREHVYHNSTGDDFLNNLSDTVKNLFSCKEVSACLSNYGITMTDAQKNFPPLTSYVNLEEVTYLKRKFVYDDVLGYRRIKAPLDPISIYEPLNWIRKCPDHWEALMQNVEGSMKEAAQHGQEFFENFKECINNALREKGQMTVSYIYQDFIRDWEKTFY